MPRVVQENTKASTKATFEGVSLPKHIKATAQDGGDVIHTPIRTSHEIESCLRL
jgi:hypothetical protein